MSFFPNNVYGGEQSEYKIAEFARLGLMPSAFKNVRRDPFLPHNMWNPSRPDGAVVEIDGPHRDMLSSPDQKRFRRWSRRLNGQEASGNGTGWVLKDDQPRCNSSPAAPSPFQNRYASAFYLDGHSASYESRLSSPPFSEGASFSGSCATGSYNNSVYERPIDFGYPHCPVVKEHRGRDHHRQRSRSHGQRRTEKRNSPYAYYANSYKAGWYPSSGRKRPRIESRQQAPPFKNRPVLQHSGTSPQTNGSLKKSPSKRCSSPVQSCQHVSHSDASYSPRCDVRDGKKYQDTEQDGVPPDAQNYLCEEDTSDSFKMNRGDSRCGGEVLVQKRSSRKSELEGAQISPLKEGRATKREASNSPKNNSKDARTVKKSPPKNEPRYRTSSNLVKKMVPGSSPKKSESCEGIRIKETVPNKLQQRDTGNPPLKIIIKSSNESWYINRRKGESSFKTFTEKERIKSKKKKKKKDKTDAESRLRRKSRQNKIADHTIKSPPQKEYFLDTIGEKAVSPSKNMSSQDVIISPVMKKEISPHEKDQNTEKKKTESPFKRSDCGVVTTSLDAAAFFGSTKDTLRTPCVDSKTPSSSASELKKNRLVTGTRTSPEKQVTAPVSHRRDSSHGKEGNAVTKLTREENLSEKHETPKNPGLKSSSDETDRHRTPTYTVKQPKLVRKRSSDAQVETTPTEAKHAENQKAARRSSPSKTDIKPKALIKTGLRSAKKDSNKSAKRRSRTPPSDSGPLRNMVQRTLESYFCKKSEASSPAGAEKNAVGQSDLKMPPAAPRSTRKSSKESAATDQAKTAASTSHVRHIFQDNASQLKLEVKRAVVRLDPLPEGLLTRPRDAPHAPSPGPAHERWGGSNRLAQVPPIPSPSKVPRSSLQPASPELEVVDVEPSKAATSLGLAVDAAPPEEEIAQAQKDEARRALEAAQRNKKRHTRGHKVYAFCDVLEEHIERHPVQNEIPAHKWSKWLNPSQLRCLISAMLENTELCLNFSLEAERNEAWEGAWATLARRLNTVCFNSLTNLNTGLRMTVAEWKTCWLEFKTRVKGRLDAMTAQERVHNLGSLDCLLFSEDLYSALLKSKGECLGEGCPRKWCSRACIGVSSPATAEPTKSRVTEE